MHKNVIIPLLCQYGLFLYTLYLKMRLYLKMPFSTSFGKTWYAETATYIYTKKRLFTHSIFFSYFVVSFSFHRGCNKAKLTKYDTGEWDEKCYHCENYRNFTWNEFPGVEIFWKGTVLHNFRRFARNYVETVPLRYFWQCYYASDSLFEWPLG